MAHIPRWLRIASGVALLIPLAVAAAGVSVRFDPGGIDTMPFPSDRFTVRDWTQNTFRRVNLPKPDCAVKKAECEDIDVINELDGFSTQPRITIPFTGEIDPASVNSETVYLVNQGDPFSLHGSGQRVGINQVLWDPATKTLVVQPDRLLRQHSRYLLVVTNGVRDANGKRIQGGRFGRGEHERSSDEYDRDMRDGLRSGHRGRFGVAAASVFTTQSITADLAKVVRQLRHSTPGPVNFTIGNVAGAPCVRCSIQPTWQGFSFTGNGRGAGFLGQLRADACARRCARRGRKNCLRQVHVARL